MIRCLMICFFLPDAVSRTARDVEHRDVGGARADRDAVVAGPDSQAGEVDVAGAADVDAVGVGAVAGRGDVEAVDGDRRAALDRHMESLAVLDGEIGDPPAVDIYQPQRLQ